MKQKTNKQTKPKRDAKPFLSQISMSPTMTKSVPVLIFTGKTRGLWLGRVIGSVSPKQNSEKTSRWLTLTQPERCLPLDPAYMIHLLPAPTTAQLNFFDLSPSFCAMPEIRLSFS